MTQAVFTEIESPKYNKNIFNRYSKFDYNHTWNSVITDGSGLLSAENTSYYSYKGKSNYALRIINTGVEGYINTGDNKLQIIIPRSGVYIFSGSIFSDTNFSNINSSLTFHLIRNGVNYPEYSFETNLNTSSGFHFGKWNRFYQLLELTAGDTIDFQIKSGNINNNFIEVLLDGLMLEFNDRNLSYPSRYVEPFNDEVQVILDLPTINSNDTYIATLNVNSILQGDYIVMSYPNELLDLELIVGTPVVYADGIVKFPIHNQSGNTVNPVNAIFNIKRV